MINYEPDKAVVDAWLLNGGAEIVLEVIRRTGWKVDVIPADDWEFLPEIVIVADRIHNTIEINGAKSPYMQAIFSVAVVRDVYVVPNKPYRDHDEAWCRRRYPMLFESDRFTVSICTHFCDSIRLSSEATLSLIGRGKAAQLSVIKTWA